MPGRVNRTLALRASQRTSGLPLCNQTTAHQHLTALTTPHLYSPTLWYSFTIIDNNISELAGSYYFPTSHPPYKLYTTHPHPAAPLPGNAPQFGICTGSFIQFSYLSISRAFSIGQAHRSCVSLQVGLKLFRSESFEFG